MEVNLFQESIGRTDADAGCHAIANTGVVQVKLATAPDGKSDHTDQTEDQDREGNKCCCRFVFHDIRLSSVNRAMVTQAEPEDRF